MAIRREMRPGMPFWYNTPHENASLRESAVICGCCSCGHRQGCVCAEHDV